MRKSCIKSCVVLDTLYCIKYSCIVSNTLVLYQIHLYCIVANTVVLYQVVVLYCMKYSIKYSCAVSNTVVLYQIQSNSFIHLGCFYILARQVHYYSEVLPTTANDTVSEFTCRNATGNCKLRTCPRSLRGG